MRSHREWPVADEARYEAAEAVAIVTYSTVFNSSPKLAAAELLSAGSDDAEVAERSALRRPALLGATEVSGE